jgi:hypothetical protein
MYLDINAAGCSNTCRHCSVDGFMPNGEFYSLDELRQIKSGWGPLTIRFEPTAHPDFPEIYCADIAIEHGGWLVTNGYGLANRADYPDILDKMRTMGIHTVAFTLHGLEAHHDWFVCRKGAYADLLLATRRIREAGFHPKWQIFVDRKGIEDVAALVETATTECGELPTLSLPYHRVGGRLWHYEELRPTLKDVESHKLNTLIEYPAKNIFSEAKNLTGNAWLEKWRTAPGTDEFRHPFEPLSWPPQAEENQLSLRIMYNRKVYMDPMCSQPILLGTLDEGKTGVLGRLARLTPPPYCELMPEEAKLLPDEQEKLHPCGFSLRYLEISKARRA